MDGFPFVHEIEVRLCDLDCRGHVNNAVLCSYIEDARVRWYAATGAPDEPPPMTEMVDMVLARTEIDYRSEVRDHTETIAVGVRVARIGNKSADLEYLLCASDGSVVAEARSVLVGFDFERGVSAAIPERWTRRLTPNRRSAPPPASTSPAPRA
jgi:acyl-CoA thioester hydrolase